jgi:hypothetical protein
MISNEILLYYLLELVSFILYSSLGLPRLKVSGTGNEPATHESRQDDAVGFVSLCLTYGIHDFSRSGTSLAGGLLLSAVFSDSFVVFGQSHCACSTIVRSDRRVRARRFGRDLVIRPCTLRCMSIAHGPDLSWLDQKAVLCIGPVEVRAEASFRNQEIHCYLGSDREWNCMRD